jgi:hypothetical protein
MVAVPLRSALAPGFFVALTSLAGCFDFADLLSDDATTGGAETDAFAVEGTLEENTCGSGSLSLSERWEFAVALRRDGSTLLWEDTPVTVSDDGRSFVVEARASCDVRGPDEGYKPPCTIVRTDRVEARFDQAEDPTSFSGTFRLDYAPTEGSDCRDLLEGPERIAGFLPCSAEYALSAERR